MSPDTGSGITKLTNCRLVRHHSLVQDHLWLLDGRIVDPEPWFFDHKRKADLTVDCRGMIVAPGFIDLQINGNTSLRPQDMSY